MRIGDAFVAIGGEFLTVAELKKKVFDWSRWVPLGCHASVVCGEVLGGDGAVLSPEMLEERERRNLVMGSFKDVRYFSGQLLVIIETRMIWNSQ